MLLSSDIVKSQACMFMHKYLMPAYLLHFSATFNNIICIDSLSLKIILQFKTQ